MTKVDSKLDIALRYLLKEIPDQEYMALKDVVDENISLGEFCAKYLE